SKSPKRRRRSRNTARPTPARRSATFSAPRSSARARKRRRRRDDLPPPRSGGGGPLGDGGGWCTPLRQYLPYRRALRATFPAVGVHARERANAGEDQGERTSLCRLMPI